MNITAWRNALKSAHKSDSGDRRTNWNHDLWVTDMDRHCAQNLLYVGSRDGYVFHDLEADCSHFYSYDPCSSQWFAESVDRW